MTAPTPERPLDVAALRRLADEYAGPDLEEVAAEEFELRVGETVAPMLPAILAALTELEGLRAEAARFLGLYDDNGSLDIVVNPDTEEETIIAAASNFPRIAAILRAAREAEEANGG